MLFAEPEIETLRRLIVEGEAEVAAQRALIAELVRVGASAALPIATLTRTAAELLANRKRLFQLTGEDPPTADADSSAKRPET